MARVIFNCESESFRFDQRVVQLSLPVRIGRSCNRNQSARNNAYFDCKVLSRNHALLSYENGRFFIQDTKSSNGTFVNGIKLSANKFESIPFELSSEDVLQFGVSIVDASSKQNHNAVIAKIRIFDSNGQERIFKRLDKISLSMDEMLQLTKNLKLASSIESNLANRIALLSNSLKNDIALDERKPNFNCDHDDLKTIISNLENRLRFYAKNVSEETDRIEISNLKEENRFLLEVNKNELKKNHEENIQCKAMLSTLENMFKITSDQLNALKKCDQEIECNIRQYHSRIEVSKSVISNLTSAIEQSKLETKELQTKHQNFINSIYSNQNEIVDIKNKLRAFQNDAFMISEFLTNISKDTDRSFQRNILVGMVAKNKFFKSIEITKSLLIKFEIPLNMLIDSFLSYQNFLESKNIHIFNADDKNNNEIIEKSASKMLCDDLSTMNFNYIKNKQKMMDRSTDLDDECTSSISVDFLKNLKEKIHLLEKNYETETQELAKLEVEIGVEQQKKVQKQNEVEMLTSQLLSASNIAKKIQESLEIENEMKLETILSLKEKLDSLQSGYQKSERALIDKETRLADLKNAYNQKIDNSQNILFLYLLPFFIFFLYLMYYVFKFCYFLV